MKKQLKANCSNCGASLEFSGSFRTKCNYCDTVNTLDIETYEKVHLSDTETPSYHCPRCGTKEWMHIQISGAGDKKTDLFRCHSCHGLFLNHIKLKAMVDQLSSQAGEEDKWALNALAEDIPFQEKGIQYLNCPECQALMARRNYGKSSGVIVDICPDHGTWLDGGELGKIFAWIKAGGKERQQRLNQMEAQRVLNKPKYTPEASPTIQFGNRPMSSSYHDEDDLLSSLIKVVRWVLR